MSSLIKNVKFGVAGALLLACAALILVSGAPAAATAPVDAESAAGEQSEQLDYPDYWPDEFAQQVHEEFDGFYNGVDFGERLYWETTRYSGRKGPPPANFFTMNELRETYGYFVDKFPQDPPSRAGRTGAELIATAPIQQNGGDKIFQINAGPSGEAALRYFVGGGIHIIPTDDLRAGGYFRKEFIPFDAITWFFPTLYIRMLSEHYKFGAESPLCEIASSKKAHLPYSCQERTQNISSLPSTGGLSLPGSALIALLIFGALSLSASALIFISRRQQK